MTALDIEKLRTETPGCARVLHFNNAGAGLMAQPVLDAVTAHLKLEAQTGGYEAADAARDAFENTYRAIATLLNCTADEIALMENATVAWQAAFYGLARDFKAGDRILTAEAEYASNYIAYLQMAERTGVCIEAVPSRPTGELDVAALENMIDDKVKLIAITHIPTNGGLVNPAAEVGRVARAAGIPYLLDACQAAGQVPLDVKAIGCDMLSATGRKYLRGPRGTGFLYVRGDFLDKLTPPMLDLHGAKWTAKNGYQVIANARKFENWEFNIAGQIGLGVAVDYLLALGPDATCQRIHDLAELLRASLSDIPGLTLHDLGSRRGGIVSFSNPRLDPNAVKQKLRAQAINCSTSSAASTRLDMEGRGLELINRASVHYYNTEDEVKRFAQALAGLIA